MNTVMYEKGMYSLYFNSLQEVLDGSPHSSNTRIYDEYFSENSDYNGPHWYGTDNERSRDVIDHAIQGHPALYLSLQSKINDMKAALASKQTVSVVKKRKRKRSRASQGDELDIHKVYQGQLDSAWSSFNVIETDRQHHLTTIMVDVSANGSVNVEDSLWRAVTAMVTAEQYIAAGKSVRIMVGSCASRVFKRDRAQVTTCVVVKEYNEPLNLERLAGMCHAGFHRSFNFGARSFAPVAVSPSMGSANNSLMTNPPLQVKEEMEGGHTKYIYIGHCDSEARAYGTIKQLID